MPRALIAPSPRAAPLPGRLGRFRVVGRLGATADATLYAADDDRRGARVVLRVLAGPLGCIDNALALARLRARADALARLAHPRLVALLEIDEIDGHALVVTEHVAGARLDDWLSATRGPLPPAIVVAMLAQLLDALEAMHLAGLVHGALDCPDIVVQLDGSLKLAGVGLAEARPGDEAADLRAAGVVLSRMLQHAEPHDDTARALQAVAARARRGDFASPLGCHVALYAALDGRREPAREPQPCAPQPRPRPAALATLPVLTAVVPASTLSLSLEHPWRQPVDGQDGLPPAGGIPAEALHRVMKILSTHVGADAAAVLKRVGPGAGSVAALHERLLDAVGGRVDRKLLARQLRAAARLPL